MTIAVDGSCKRYPTSRWPIKLADTFCSRNIVKITQIKNVPSKAKSQNCNNGTHMYGKIHPGNGIIDKHNKFTKYVQTN